MPAALRCRDQGRCVEATIRVEAARCTYYTHACSRNLNLKIETCTTATHGNSLLDIFSKYVRTAAFLVQVEPRTYLISDHDLLLLLLYMLYVDNHLLVRTTAVSCTRTGLVVQ